MTSTLASQLSKAQRVSLATLPTAVQPLERLSEHLDGPELWMKRDDLTGLAGGGNKTRKLEFVIADALAGGADTLVTVGAIQSNHTRQTAAAAARVGMKCVLLHNGWAPDAGPFYRSVGNILLSEMMGAELYGDDTPRSLEDAGHIDQLMEHLRQAGHHPYLIPGGASEHPLGGHGYAGCAAEIVSQSDALGVSFDVVVHCTGSSSTQAGLLAGFAALGAETKVIGVADDGEREEKVVRVHRLANMTLENLGLDVRVPLSDVEVVVADELPYGVPSEETLAAVRLLARYEGLIADPVYEGRTIQGLLALIEQGKLQRGQRVLVMHLGGTPAVNAYANRFSEHGLSPLPFAANVA